MRSGRVGHRPSSVFLDQLYQRFLPSVINGSCIEAGIVYLDGILDGHTLYVKTLEKIIPSTALKIETQRATRTTKSNTFNKHNKDFHVHHTFLYIYLPSLHDYDAKFPYTTFCGRCKQATTNFLSLSELGYGTKKSTLGELSKT